MMKVGQNIQSCVVEPFVFVASSLPDSTLSFDYAFIILLKEDSVSILLVATTSPITGCCFWLLIATVVLLVGGAVSHIMITGLIWLVFVDWSSLTFIYTEI